MGAGRTELFEAIFGLSTPSVSGDILIENKKITIKSPSDAVKAGLALVSEDRKKDGIIPELSVKKNISLTTLLGLSKNGILSSKNEKQLADKYINDLKIKTSSDAQLIKNLSGGMGFLLLILRLGVLESGLFNQMKGKTSTKGDLRLLFKNKDYIKKYISICVLGFPVWFVNGVVMTFTLEIGKAWGMNPIPSVSAVFTYYFIGLTFGDLTAGFVSQYLQSRKKAIRLYLIMYTLGAIVFFAFANQSLTIWQKVLNTINSPFY